MVAELTKRKNNNHKYVCDPFANMQTVLLKYGHPVAKCDPWVHRATQGPTIDGPFGDQWIFQVLQKCFGMKVERRFQRCTDIKCPLCLIKMRIPFGPFWPFLIGCVVSADYWFLTDYPELRRAPQPSTIGSPLGEPGFCIFCSTVQAAVSIWKCTPPSIWGFHYRDKTISMSSYLYKGNPCTGKITFIWKHDPCPTPSLPNYCDLQIFLGYAISVSLCIPRIHLSSAGTLIARFMGPTWGWQDPGGPHVGPMNFAIWDSFRVASGCMMQPNSYIVNNIMDGGRPGHTTKGLLLTWINLNPSMNK